MGFAVAGQVVYNGNLDHRVGTGTLAHRSARHIDEHLRGEGGIVDLHVEREELIVRASRDTFAREVHTVSHVVEGVGRFHGLNAHLLGQGRQVDKRLLRIQLAEGEQEKCGEQRKMPKFHGRIKLVGLWCDGLHSGAKSVGE